MELIGIHPQGPASRRIGNLSPSAKEVVQATVQMYAQNGFAPPWIGYLGFEDEVCVGTCAFKTAPRDNAVEIAYYTFSEFEGRGVATRMARQLIQIARADSPAITITAQTLPIENASNHILTKLGFAFAGEFLHPEDGRVWVWTLGSQVGS